MCKKPCLFGGAFCFGNKSLVFRLLSMQVVTTSSQVIKCIPREKTLSVTLELRDEQTREITTKNLTGTEVGNFIQYDLDFTPIEGNYYSITLKEGANILYRDMLFCTNQTNFDAYKISKDEYVSPTTNNEYIFNE